MKRELWLPAAPESAPRARAIVREAAAAQGLDGNAVWDLMLATSEAFSNAVRHGRACESGHRGILLCVEPCPNGLLVEVCDCGEFEALPRRAGPDDTGGRGIPLMIAVMDTFELLPDGRQTRVRFGKTGDVAAVSG